MRRRWVAPHTLPKVAWLLFPLSRLLSWGSWLQGWNFAWKYVLLSEEGGQAASVRSLNVKFSHCPECYLHKFLGECVIWCYHSFFLSVCVFLAFMSTHLVIVLAFHWMSVTECAPEGSQHELWHMTEGKKKTNTVAKYDSQKWGQHIFKESAMFSLTLHLAKLCFYTPAR